MTAKKKLSGRGGKREGAGAKKKDPLIKKQPMTIKLPGWMREKLKDLPAGQGPEIEKALIAMHGWKPPIIGKE